MRVQPFLFLCVVPSCLWVFLYHNSACHTSTDSGTGKASSEMSCVRDGAVIFGRRCGFGLFLAWGLGGNDFTIAGWRAGWLLVGRLVRFDCGCFWSRLSALLIIVTLLVLVSALVFSFASTICLRSCEIPRPTRCTCRCCCSPVQAGLA
jgi:hypothetical protein